MNPQKFVAKWKLVTLKERSGAQEHFLDICHLLDHPTPAEFDPRGLSYAFEAATSKGQGARGFADVWKRGFFAWEYKGPESDLETAYAQLLQYREALENPPLLIVSDLSTILIRTNFTSSVRQEYRLSLDDLLLAPKLAILRSAFYDPAALRAPSTPEQVTEEAAANFAQIADILRKWGEEPHQIAHFLIRLLFCLFAEDAGLLPQGLFATLVQSTRTDPRALSEQLTQLFHAMSTGGYFGAQKVRHFDGGLFGAAPALELDSSAIDVLASVSTLDWSAVEPSILGTLFERSLDPSKRSQIGAQYTSRTDIDLVIEAVLMSPLRSRWAAIRDDVLQLLGDSTPKARPKRLAKAISILDSFSTELSSVEVLDPACGSGNFLYVALRQLLTLEKEVITFSGEIGGTLFFPKVSPSQLLGIEITPYAFELAQATIWIGYIQWLRENGFGIPSEPILKPLHNFTLGDAILRLPPNAEPYEPSWPDADFIIGNPPYLGNRKMRPLLGDEYCDALLSVYGDRIEGMPDLVCYWFEKARALIAAGNSRRAGLLGTQAIRGGTNRQVLDRIKASGDIFMAWSDRNWILDGATVHVSIVGFDDGSQKEKRLDGRTVPAVNSDLTSGIDTSPARPLKENEGIAFQGVVLRGPFNISADLASRFLAERGNPNERPNSDVIKPRRTGQDVVGIPSNEYVVDFGVDMPLERAAEYAAPFEYLKQYVFPMRQKARQREAREKWWIHWNPRRQLREAILSLHRYIATPRLAKHRIFVWLDASILPDAQLVIFAREDDFSMGVLHSRVHEVWARRMGTQLRDAVSGFRYTHTTAFLTFAFPDSADPKAVAATPHIAQAARTLHQKRVAWLSPSEPNPTRTLTSLYNEAPTWLTLAHRDLDQAVFSAYGLPSTPTDQEIFDLLITLNLSRKPST